MSRHLRQLPAGQQKQQRLTRTDAIQKITRLPSCIATWDLCRERRQKLPLGGGPVLGVGCLSESEGVGEGGLQITSGRPWRTQVGQNACSHVTQRHSEAGGDALSTAPVYPSWDGNYGLGMLHHKRKKKRPRGGGTSPLSPPSHRTNRVRPKEMGITSPSHPPRGRSRPAVGRRRSGPRTTRTPHDAEEKLWVRRTRYGPAGAGLRSGEERAARRG